MYPHSIFKKQISVRCQGRLRQLFVLFFLPFAAYMYTLESNASVSVRTSPPATAGHLGWGITNLVWPQGWAFAYLRATPGLLTPTWFPTRNSNMEDFIRND